MGEQQFVDQSCFGSLWSFPDFSREAPILRQGVGKPTPGRPACLAHPVFILSIPERSPQPLLVAWPRALWGGTQLHSDIPAAAQTQWHFVKSWATPSPLSVCWRCRGNQIPCLYVPPSLPCSSQLHHQHLCRGLLGSLPSCQGT